jgi:hypothetical protein
MITKDEAGYISIAPGAAQCANCIMFAWGICDLVQGMIEPYAVCNYWEEDTVDNAPSVGQVVNIDEPVGLQAGQVQR